MFYYLIFFSYFCGLEELYTSSTLSPISFTPINYVQYLILNQVLQVLKTNKSSGKMQITHQKNSSEKHCCGMQTNLLLLSFIITLCNVFNLATAVNRHLKSKTLHF